MQRERIHDILTAEDRCVSPAFRWTLSRASRTAGGRGREGAMRSVSFVVSVVVTSTALGGAGVAVAAVITGTPGNDTLLGTDQADQISGLAGNDLIHGLAGSDRIDAGPGDDTVLGDDGCPAGTSGAPYYCIPGGRPGNDRLSGGAGDDRLSGGSGNDRIRARDGEAELVNCGAGRDVAFVDADDEVTDNCEVARPR